MGEPAFIEPAVEGLAGDANNVFCLFQIEYVINSLGLSGSTLEFF